MQWWDLKNIKNKDFILSLWGTLLLVLPGVAALAIFEPTTFSSLSWVTLIFLSASITFPFVVLNTVAVFILEKVKVTDKEGLFRSFFLSSLATGLYGYVVIAASYAAHFTLRTLLIIATVIEILFLLFVLGRDFTSELRKKDEKEQKKKLKIPKNKDEDAASKPAR